MANGKTKTFTVDFTSELDGETFHGTFTSKRLSIMDNVKIARRKSELCGGMFCVRNEEGDPTGQGIDDWSEVQARMIAILEVAIIQKPSWWNLADLEDEDLMGVVFEEVMSYENSFRIRRREANKSEDSDGSGSGDSEEQHKTTESNNNAPKVVDGQVPASLDA